MDNREEKFRQEREDGQENPATQAVQRAWHTSSRGKYYSEERASKADIQSVDRVWGRLAEHITMNNAAYRNNSNVQRRHAYESTYQHYQPNNRYQRLQQSLGSIAAVLVLTFIIVSMFAVSNTARQASNTSTASGSMQALPNKFVPLGRQIKITIMQVHGIIEFQPRRNSVALGEVVIVFNMTSAVQTVNSDDNQILPLKPLKGAGKLHFNTSGLHILSLASDVSIQATINVLDTRIIIKSSSKGGLGFFQPAVQKLSGGVPIIWSNETDQTQLVISSSQSCTDIKIPPGQQQSDTFCKTSGPHTFHLQSNPKAQVTIVLMN